MRALLIDEDGVSEIAVELSQVMRRWPSCDSFDLGNGHDVWLDDEGLFTPGVTLADIGRTSRVPLPVYVLGSKGESCVDATMTVDELAGMVTMRGRPGAVAADGG